METSDVNAPDPVDPVAAVVSAMESLDDLPLDQHVSVFEQAHEQLRRSLDVKPGA